MNKCFISKTPASLKDLSTGKIKNNHKMRISKQETELPPFV